VQTNDGGYMVASSGEKLFKTDPEGNEQWTRTYEHVYFNNMAKTKDGGCILAGSNFWLGKIDSLGTLQWNETYGVLGYDQAFSVIQTSDGGYAVLGVEGNSLTYVSNPRNDFWLVKTDSMGNIQWNKTYGGRGDNVGNSVIQTKDGGYMLAGSTNAYGEGGRDALIIKTDSTGNMIWNKTYGGGGIRTKQNSSLPNGQIEKWGSNGTGYDDANAIIQTSDGGLAFAGATELSPPSYETTGVWLVKTDSNGTAEWNETFPSVQDGYWLTYSGNSLIETRDGALVMGGFSQVPGFPWIGNYYLLKINAGLPPSTSSPAQNPNPLPPASILILSGIAATTAIISLFHILKKKKNQTAPTNIPTQTHTLH
jgi:hypothetical protein